jgi:SAM-dependent methyltransferase
MSPTAPPPDLKSRMAASYDAIAQTYFTTFAADDKTKNTRLTYLSRLLDLLKDAKPNTAVDAAPVKVLELGCGAGIPGTKSLLENTTPPLHVTANDFSTAQIDLARTYLASYLPPSRSPRLTLIPGDMTALTFPPSTFAAVVAFYSIIHLPRQEQTLLLQKIATWLEPGGLFLANFAAEENENSVEEKWLGEDQGWMYWSSWGEEGSVKMIEECGLEVLVREISNDVVDSRFVWVIARKKEVAK